MLTGDVQDFTPEDNADFFTNPADVDDRGIVANLLGPDGLPGACHTADTDDLAGFGTVSR